MMVYYGTVMIVGPVLADVACAMAKHGESRNLRGRVWRATIFQPNAKDLITGDTINARLHMTTPMIGAI